MWYNLNWTILLPFFFHFYYKKKEFINRNDYKIYTTAIEVVFVYMMIIIVIMFIKKVSSHLYDCYEWTYVLNAPINECNLMLLLYYNRKYSLLFFFLLYQENSFGHLICVVKIYYLFLYTYCSQIKFWDGKIWASLNLIGFFWEGVGAESKSALCYQIFVANFERNPQKK